MAQLLTKARTAAPASSHSSAHTAAPTGRRRSSLKDPKPKSLNLKIGRDKGCTSPPPPAAAHRRPAQPPLLSDPKALSPKRLQDARRGAHCRPRQQPPVGTHRHATRRCRSFQNPKPQILKPEDRTRQGARTTAPASSCPPPPRAAAAAAAAPLQTLKH